MNGSLRSCRAPVEIKLQRGPAGLGFNIVGGLDQQYVVNDSGIYVSKIKEDGAAALDGRLEEGDKILEINGVKLEKLTHKHVVELFRTAGEDVELRVQKKMPDSTRHLNGPAEPQPDQQPPLPVLGLLALLAAAGLVFAFIYKRTN
ncbi:synaptojanin-2-binding protein [Cololabis saira]|uniref:synaptojanin-2-binding protein n=1 Tax=Cololabis saira TaxID=129043 RepID=UPI002AD42A37|nr:synaptojanin-2-binding protein [Cololabis saira]